MKDRTRAIHPPAVEVPADNRPLVSPIYQSVKFEFKSIGESLRQLRGERPGFFYQRSSNPTTRQLELSLAALQGRDDCIVSGSGVAAMSTCLLSLCKAGDHVLCFVETYGPTRTTIRRMLGKFGVEHTMLSIEDDAGIEVQLGRALHALEGLVALDHAIAPPRDLLDDFLKSFRFMGRIFPW